MNKTELLKIFKSKNAILTGHFLLSSGLHSNKYVQCALALQYPQIAKKLAKLLVNKLNRLTTQPLNRLKIDVVVSPALGGIVIGQEVAELTGSRAIFTEREGGEMKLRRGFEINPGECCVIVEDVITTGSSTNEVIDVVQSFSGEIVAIAAIIDRSGGKVKFKFPIVSLLKLNIKTWRKNNCPLCKKSIPIVKPGSRGLK